MNEKIMKNILVVGGGYIGLPLALLASRNNFCTYIYDNNEEKCELLQKGISGIDHDHDVALQDSISKDLIKILSGLEEEKSSTSLKFDVIVICVPTPLKVDKLPDISMIVNACEQVTKLMDSSTLLILESSTYPGTTRKVVLPILRNQFVEMDNEQILLAHSPERIDPGNEVWNNKNTPRILSGLNDISLKKSAEFYSQLGIPIVEVSSLEIAEATKLFENTFRLINIAFVNEFAEVMRRIGLEAGEVLKAAYTKPFGILPFQISAGIGGHCIPVDPYYLTWWVNSNGERLTLVEAAQKINENAHKYSLRRIKELLGENLFNKRILIAGITYKPGVADIRETPALALWNELELEGSHLWWWDPLIQTWGNRRKYDEGSPALDLVVIVTSVPLPNNVVNKYPTLDLNG